MQAAYRQLTGADVLLMSSENTRFHILLQGPKYFVTRFRLEWTCRRFESVDFFKSGRRRQKQKVRQ
jgi:hypothetical protein